MIRILILSLFLACASFAQVTIPWDQVDKTGATKADVGLDQVDNTSDAAKPISTAVQAALTLKADKADLAPSLPATLVTGTTPLGMTFGTIRNSPVFSLLREKWLLHDDDFNVSSVGRYKVATSSNVSVAVANGVLTVTGTAAGAGYYKIYTGVPVSVPYMTAKVRMAKLGDGNLEQTAFIGFYKDNGSMIDVYYNRDTTTLGFEVKRDYTLRINWTDTAVTLVDGSEIAICVTGKYVSVWTNQGNGWKHHTSQDTSAWIDFTNPTVGATYFAYVGAASDNSATVHPQIDRYQVGYFGAVGMRDPTLVKWRNGTPVMLGVGKYLFTATNGGPYSGGADSRVRFASAHHGVYVYDATTHTYEEVGKLFSLRDGRIYGDHDGVAMVDPTSFSVTYVNNTWGTGTAPVHIRYATFDLNGLFGVNIIPTTEVPGLSGWEKWGGDLVDVGGTLYLPYSKRTVANASADFYSGVASGASITTLSDVSFDLATANQEGIKYTRVGGVNYWVATQSNGPINVYNFAFTTKLGALTTDFTWTAPPAHPCIIPVNRADGNTEYHLLAFNNDIIFSGASGSYGSFVVAKGSAVNTGREFPTLRGLFGWR